MLSSDLSKRLEDLQLPADATELENLGDQNAESAESCRGLGSSDSRPKTPAHGAPPIQDTGSDYHGNSNLEAPQQGLSAKDPFDLVLASTRVYSRVEDREIDAMSSVLTTRSRAWSILSGLSLTKISIVSVIKLPLHELELIRFNRLASPSLTGFRRSDDNNDVSLLTEDHHTLEFKARYGLIPRAMGPMGAGSLKRLSKELAAIRRDPLSSVSLGPIHEDDMVC